MAKKGSRAYLYDHNYCLQCKIRFESKKFGAKFCSTKCRVAHNRKNKATSQKLLSIQEDLYSIIQDRPIVTKADYETLYNIIRIAQRLADDYDFNRPLF